MIVETPSAAPQPPLVPRAMLGRDRTPRLVLRPRVLLAEHDEQLRDVLRWALHRDGCDVIVSKNGDELLDYLATSRRWRHLFPPPDLILSDLDMPGLADGQALAEMRSLVRRTPIIGMSSHPDATGLDPKDGLRVVGVYKKPLDLDAIRRAVRATIET